MTSTHDIVVIGGGSAGLTGTRFAARLGARVALIEKNRLGDVVSNRFQPRVIVKMREVPFMAREVVVDTDHPVTVPNEAIHQMRPEKARPANHQYALTVEAHYFRNPYPRMRPSYSIARSVGAVWGL